MSRRGQPTLGIRSITGISESTGVFVWRGEMLSTGAPGSDSQPATRRIEYGISQKDLRELCELCGRPVTSRVRGRSHPLGDMHPVSGSSWPAFVAALMWP